ncbi:MAG TPA: substrate-binding domain-containing protein, partial [Capsulimonadaceae bacterium]|nr:substrate-binding domain-containing protein [Capsulimonadaceae bacterium]
AVAIADRQPSFPSLVADEVQGMRLLIDFLWERGHRKIIYATSHVPLASIEARSQTFVRLVSERGGEPIVRPIQSHAAEKLVDEVLAMSDPPTAICCWNDYYAYLLIAECLKSGVRIPDDLAIVGFDGLLETRLPARRLVTVAVPWAHMASEAVRILVRQIGGEKIPDLTVFPVSLVEGDTA